MTATPLLGPDEPEPVELLRPDGRSAVLLACDHAGRRLPGRLGRLGLDEREFDRHIAWDIGAMAVTRVLSEALDATAVAQRYSRLAIDCNRPLSAASSIPVVSELTTIPGNLDLPEVEREVRVRELFRPYHDELETTLDARAAAGRRTILVAVHSFTPVYDGVARPWHVGTLYGRDGRLAASLGRLLRAEPGLVVGDNEPYSVSDETDYTLPVHGERRGLVHVGLEIRQDEVAEPAGQAAWGARLARLLPLAIEDVP